MRIVFFGSGDFGLPTLQALEAGPHEIAAVVTQPPRRAGRGGKMRLTPIHAHSEPLGCTIFTPEKPNTTEFEENLRAVAPDLAVVVAYGHLLKKTLLSIPKHGFVNLHASLLPAYRGAAPVPWAILEGQKVSGATVFQLDEKFDTGAVIGTAELPIDDNDTSESYLTKLAPFGAELMSRCVDDIAAGRAVPQVQDNSRASRAPKLTKEDGLIDWSCPLDNIERMVRAFQPWPQAYTILEACKGDVRINVLELKPCPEIPPEGEPGLLLASDPKSGLVFMTGGGPARLTRIQPEGKRAMSDTDFLRGTEIKRQLHECNYTPRSRQDTRSAPSDS